MPATVGSSREFGWLRMASDSSRGEFVFFDLKPSTPDIRTEICAGLGLEQKTISPKYLYDSRGSLLFDTITGLPEYYLTRVEIGILHERRREMSHMIERGSWLLEYGAGSGRKSRIMLETINPAAYIPVDISSAHLVESAQQIHREFIGLSVYPICADYTQAFEMPEVISSDNRAVFFPGSSIGNFGRDEARNFLKTAADVVGENGAIVLGVDTRKSANVIEPAYNDSRCVTAMFNKNILQHLNNEIGSDFQLNYFDHRAFYDEQEGCLQMHLVCNSEHEVTIGADSFTFREGETIHTENSFKYSANELEEVASQAGFTCEAIWTDRKEWFMVAFLRNCP